MNIQEFKKSQLPIVEIFNSISGEGISSGEIVTFVRVAGCNLRCSYCDTKYSYDVEHPENKLFTPDQVIEAIEKFNTNKIICTGGEPLEEDTIKRYLPLYLASKGYDVRIETNGSCPLYSLEEREQFSSNQRLNLKYTLDFKMPSSRMDAYNIYEKNVLKLNSNDEIKFVVGTEEDLECAFTLIKKYHSILSDKNIIVNFSPVFGEIEVERIIEFLKEHHRYFENKKIIARLSLQIHKMIWSPDQKGV